MQEDGNSIDIRIELCGPVISFRQTASNTLIRQSGRDMPTFHGIISDM